MRIVVHGQEAFGKAVLEKLLERKENVVGVFCAPDKAGRPEDPLKVFAKEKGLPVHQPKSWKIPEALELMKSTNADLCVMAYVTLFVPQPVIDAPKLGTIQYHPSLLPLHRGPSSINWPIAMGRTETGLSIFWPDEGLDEGPILLQKKVTIGPDETLGDVYFKKLFPLGVEAMMESVDLVKAGKAPRVAAGPFQEDLRKLVQEGRRRDRLVQARRRGLQPDPRRQPRAWRLGHDQGSEGGHFRQRQSRRIGQARRSGRARCQRHDDRCGRRCHPGKARARGGRQEGRSFRVGQDVRRQSRRHFRQACPQAESLKTGVKASA